MTSTEEMRFINQLIEEYHNWNENNQNSDIMEIIAELNILQLQYNIWYYNRVNDILDEEYYSGCDTETE